MLDLPLIECRKCGAIYHANDEIAQIREFEQVTLLIKKVGKCAYCPGYGRNPTNNPGPDFGGWDEDVWRSKIK